MRWLFRYSLSIDEYIVSSVANQNQQTDDTSLVDRYLGQQDIIIYEFKRLFFSVKFLQYILVVVVTRVKDTSLCIRSIVISKNLVEFYFKCCILIGYATRYLFVDRWRVAKQSCSSPLPESNISSQNANNLIVNYMSQGRKVKWHI